MKADLQPAEGGVAGAQAIRRAIDVIRAVAQMQRSGATLSRVAHATGLSSSTAFRILRSLTEERMLRYVEEDRRYYLGLLAFELGLAVQGQSRVQDYWRETLEHIARRTRLTTYLMARSDTEAVCLSCVQGTTVIRAMPIEVGQRLPLGIGGGSLAILSTLADTEVERVLAARAGRLDLFPGGQEEVGRILARVEEARRNGYAHSSGSVAKGLSGIGVAIMPQVGLMQLAISVSAVAEKIAPSEARQIAAVITDAIRRRLSSSSSVAL